MDLSFAAASEAVKMVVRAIPNAFKRLLRTTPPDFLLFEIEEKVARLSKEAQVVLWHLADCPLRPEPMDIILKEARMLPIADGVIRELSREGLIASNFDGTQFVRPELLSRVRQALCKPA